MPAKRVLISPFGYRAHVFFDFPIKGKDLMVTVKHVEDVEALILKSPDMRYKIEDLRAQGWTWSTT